MRYIIFLLLLLLLPILGCSQTIQFGTGIVYTTGVPSHDPGTRGSRVVVDLNTRIHYRHVTGNTWEVFPQAGNGIYGGSGTIFPDAISTTSGNGYTLRVVPGDVLTIGDNTNSAGGFGTIINVVGTTIGNVSGPSDKIVTANNAFSEIRHVGNSLLLDDTFQMSSVTGTYRISGGPVVNGFKGYEYEFDYSPNFSPLSLITKQYADSLLSSGGNGIYGGSGMVPLNTIATIDSGFTFQSDTITGQFTIDLYQGLYGSYFNQDPDQVFFKYDDLAGINSVRAYSDGLLLQTQSGVDRIFLDGVVQFQDLTTPLFTDSATYLVGVALNGDASRVILGNNLVLDGDTLHANVLLDGNGIYGGSDTVPLNTYAYTPKDFPDDDMAFAIGNFPNWPQWFLEPEENGIWWNFKQGFGPMLQYGNDWGDEEEKVLTEMYANSIANTVYYDLRPNNLTSNYVKNTSLISQTRQVRVSEYGTAGFGNLNGVIGDVIVKPNKGAIGVGMGKGNYSITGTSYTFANSDTSWIWRVSMTKTASNAGGTNARDILSIKLEDTTSNNIALYSYKYRLPNATPSTTLSNKSVMVWTGTGSGTIPAFELLPASIGPTDLSFSGAGSPVSLLSSTGTDVTFTQGTGVTLSATGTNLTITNAAPDQVVSLTGGGITNITGTYPNFTITSTEVDGSITNELQNLGYTAATGALTITSGTGTTIPVMTSTTRGLVPDGDGSGTDEFLREDGTWAVPPTGGSTPAGANYQVQYYDTGNFGAEAEFNYNPANNQLVVGHTTTGATLHGRYHAYNGGSILRLETKSGSDVINVYENGYLKFGIAETYPRFYQSKTAGGSVDSLASGIVASVSIASNTGSEDMFSVNHPAISPTSGNKSALRINGTFEPTSGNANWIGIEMTPTINQTGTSSGIAHGLRIAPTLTDHTQFFGLRLEYNPAFDGYGVYQSGDNVINYMAGKVGFGNLNTGPVSLVDIDGPNGHSQLRLNDTYTPTTSSDTNGGIGEISWDSNYLYIKIANHTWKRVALTSF